MRHIGNLPTEEQASAFEDYMLASETRVKVDPEDGAWAVWVIEEDQFEAAREQLARFREDPGNSRYNSHSATARQIRKEEKKAAEQFKKNQIDVRTRWSRNSSGLRAGPATKALIGISVAIFLMAEFSGNDELYSKLTFVEFGRRAFSGIAFGLEGILSGQVWRIITPIFIHFGIIHIVFNMMVFHQFSLQIEAKLGPIRFVGLVIAIAAISNVGQFTWDRLTTNTGLLTPFGGMSGVICGLFGYIWMKARFEPQERYIMSQQTVNFILIYLALCMTGLVGRMLGGSIANAAHLVGLVAGMGIGYWNTFVRRYLK